MTKICTKCKETKEIKKFAITHKIYRLNICRSCKSHTTKEIFGKYIRNARRRKINFSLTFEEFCDATQQTCRYCGSHLLYPALDRLDNKQGYTLSNVCACCPKCNFLKHTLSETEFLQQVEKIYLNGQAQQNSIST